MLAGTDINGPAMGDRLTADGRSAGGTGDRDDLIGVRTERDPAAEDLKSGRTGGVADEGVALPERAPVEGAGSADAHRGKSRSAKIFDQRLKTCIGHGERHDTATNRTRPPVIRRAGGSR